MSAHTPGPWKYDMGLTDNDTTSNVAFITDDDGFLIARLTRTGPQKSLHADTAFIVRACNAHEELLAALRRSVEAMAARMPHCSVLPDARAAIAKAEGNTAA